MKLPCVYIMANKPHGTLYVGVTSQLIGRVWQHKTGAVAGFTAKYNLNKLMWYEVHTTMYDAITREKQIKAGNRRRLIRNGWICILVWWLRGRDCFTYVRNDGVLSSLLP